ncbi:MAG: rRNA methyltransferase [Rhodospirillaceae bacterium]|nr:rRNA methyltransferase [Rhodospirillaceae bacterium]|tara:strand:+ start:1103 stop:1582 length:480 start_codon:yes stop_codon:yes gene_type:complete
MRGFFAIGVENLSKQMNAGNLFRSAHAFGASFAFTIGGMYSPNLAKSNTSKSIFQMPIYNYNRFSEFITPENSILVGVELTENSIDLPKFRHPSNAIYILGPEKGNLSKNIMSSCKYTVKIPTKFCINLAMAGAIVMYDRVISLGQYDPRPVVFNQNCS